jgi:acetoin utilization deacetylase AcuC-like enzyme
VKKTLFLSHPSLLEHGIDSHPENPGRLQAILESLEKSPFLDVTCTRKASVEELSAVHDVDYINHVLSVDGYPGYLDPETPMAKGSVQAALLAAGLGLEVVEQVLDGKIENGFALIRPPGHHAIHMASLGFCVFNNIAVAAKKALARGLQRILIIDWDVHHGNGTQEAFYDDDRVLVIDLHQDNLFPQGSGTLEQIGEGRGLGYMVNIPLPDSCRDDDYLWVFEKIIKPIAHEYKPELILVSAGFDAHESDPLASMMLTTDAYGRLTNEVKLLAYELSAKKFVLFLEGGYNVPYLVQNVLACANVLSGGQPTVAAPLSEPYSYGMQPYIEKLYDFHVTHSRRRATKPNS